MSPAFLLFWSSKTAYDRVIVLWTGLLNYLFCQFVRLLGVNMDQVHNRIHKRDYYHQEEGHSDKFGIRHYLYKK